MADKTSLEVAEPPQNDGIFRRPEEAQRIVGRILGGDPLYRYTPGLFIAAPRRTGKTSFAVNELMPQIESAGAVAIYCDLWEDQTRDPADLLGDAIRSKMKWYTRAGRSLRAALRAVKQVSVGAGIGENGPEADLSFEFDIDRIGKAGGPTLSKAIVELSRQLGRPVVIIIDEAQEMLRSDTGLKALYALKTARDRLNLGSPNKPRFGLIAMGSSRSKLARLVEGEDAAFMGAMLIDLPTLGRPYVEFVIKNRFSKQQATSLLRNASDLHLAFEKVQFRPEEFNRVLQRAADSGAITARRILVEADKRHDELMTDVANRLAPLSPLERAIIELSVRENGAFSVMDSRSLEYLTRRCEGDGVKVTPKAASEALRGLLAEGLVWKDARGHHVSDEMIAQAMKSKAFIELITQPLALPNGLWIGPKPVELLTTVARAAAAVSPARAPAKSGSRPR